MPDAPIQLLVAAFQDENGATAALTALKEAKKERIISIKDAAVLRKDASGKLHVNDIGDITGTRGGVMGGVIGAGLGILTGGATIAIAGVGALVGGLAAKLRDSGFDDARLRALGEGLKPGSSAIVAVIEHTWVAELEAELRQAGADVVVEGIAADIAAQLDAGSNVGYTAISTEDGTAAARIVSDPPAS